MSKKTIEEYLVELRRISDHRTKGAETKIRKLYKKILKEMQEFLGVTYAQRSQDGTLTYAMLQQQGYNARFLEEVVARLDGLTAEETAIINNLVNETYDKSYTGMIEAVTKANKSPNVTEVLKKELEGVDGTIPQVVKASVENPIPKLVLKDTLEKKRQDIIYNIKQEVSTGLVQGDRYTTMAKRISKSLDGDYQKAVRIARTEAHRVREGGLNDAAEYINEAIETGDSGLVMVKKWVSMKDERVRSTHSDMNGKVVKADEAFELPSGATAKCPGNSGIASEDINCRCFLSYDLITIEEYWEVTGKKPQVEERYITYTKEDLRREYKKAKVTKEESNILYGTTTVDLDERLFNKIDWNRVPSGYIFCDGSFEINRKLRTGEQLTYGEKVTADTLSSVINRTTLSDNITVTRLVSEDYVNKVFNGIDIDTIYDGYADDEIIGTVIKEKGFVSTSAGENEMRRAIRSNDVVLNLKAKKGTHAFVTDNYAETEIIFDKGTEYTITGIDDDEYGRLVILAEIIKK